MRAVAEVAGVSVATVSNVINNPDLVARRTRQRVEDAIKQVGFVRNGPARQLRARKSTVVGGVMIDLANPFFAEVARGVEDQLAEAGCTLMLCSTDGAPSRESHCLRILEEQMVRGLLVTPSGTGLDGLIQIKRRGTPVVLLDHPRDGIDMCAVTVDDVAGGEAAAGHLLELGHRRIAYFVSALPVQQSIDRRTGFGNAIRSAGLDVDEILFDVPLDRATAEVAETRLDAALRGPRPATAILCVSDVVALGVLRGLRGRGVRVPEEVSVVGHDDVGFAGLLAPALTTVRQPKYQLGRSAAELLLAEDLADHEHREIRYRPRLIVRDSTAPPSARRGP